MLHSDGQPQGALRPRHVRLDGTALFELASPADRKIVVMVLTVNLVRMVA